jgi:hypothetical protein
MSNVHDETAVRVCLQESLFVNYPVHIRTNRLLNIHFNITYPSLPFFSKWPISKMLQAKSVVIVLT